MLQLQKKVVEDNLIRYHKSIIMQLVGTAANGNVKTLTNLQFILGFSQYQISQVLDNLHRIFSIADVCNLVEIWDRRHAQRILSIVSNVFKDINVNSDSLVAVNDTDNSEFDDELLDEWHEFLQDDELYEMIVDNMSVSHLESPALEEENANDSCNDDVMTPAVLATVENMALDH